jgi:hypothetical protein
MRLLVQAEELQATASLPEEVAVKQEWSLLVALDRNDFSAAGGRCFH